MGSQEQHGVMGRREGRDWKREGGERKPENSAQRRPFGGEDDLVRDDPALPAWWMTGLGQGLAGNDNVCLSLEVIGKGGPLLDVNGTQHLGGLNEHKINLCSKTPQLPGA